MSCQLEKRAFCLVEWEKWILFVFVRCQAFSPFWRCCWMAGWRFERYIYMDIVTYTSDE